MAGRTRKTAAKKAAPYSSWPLAPDQYLSTPNIHNRSVSSGSAVEQLRKALGLEPGNYDGPVRKAVIEAQRDAGIGVSGVVTPADWDLIVNGLTPEPPEEPDVE